MNAFSSMFKKALLPETISRTSNQVKQKPNQGGNTIELFDNEEMEVSGDGNHSFISNTPVNSDSPESSNDSSELQKPFVGVFKILGDEEDEEDDDCMEREEPMEVSCQHACPTSHTSTKTRINSFDDRLKEDTVFRRLKEDTVIRKIVGSKVFDEPRVENACHHGLVDPTVNLKEAIDDINDMFGKPLNFEKVRKQKKQEKVSKSDCSNQAFFILADDDNIENDINDNMFGKPLNFEKVQKKQEKLSKSDCSNQAFFILADDDNIENDLHDQATPCISHSSNGEIKLFEPTLFTKEAMNEINDLFGKPLDF